MEYFLGKIFDSETRINLKVNEKQEIAKDLEITKSLVEDQKLNFPGKDFDIEKNQDSKVDEKQNIVIRRKIFKQLNKEQKSNDLGTSRYIPMKVKKIPIDAKIEF